MSSVSSTQSRPKLTPRAAPLAATVSQVETKAVAGAQMLAEAVTTFALPASTKRHTGGRGAGKHAATFLQAYSTLGKAVPKGSRVLLLREMVKALEQTIEAEEPAGGIAARSATGKAQHENDEFLATMRLQEQARRVKDAANHKLLSSGEMAARIGVTTQALSAAVRAQRMFVLAGPSGGNFFPAFFADTKYDRPVLAKVSKMLGGLSGGSKWDFFTTPRISLKGRTPLEALAKGNIEEVMAAAAAFRDE